MRRLFIRLLFVGLVPVLLLAAPGARAAQVFSHETDLTGLQFPDLCTGQTVTLSSGTDRFQVAVTINGNTFHLDMHDQLSNVHGTDPTGTSYVINGASHSTMNINQPPPNATGEVTTVSHSNVIAQGSAPNEVFDDTFHITVDHQGNVTAMHSDLDMSCR